MSKIHYVSAFDSSPDKNIGGAINKAILQLNAAPEDWIVNCDSDVLWLLPDSKKQLEEILQNTDYDLLSTLTNRLGSKTQLAPGLFDETDILRHINAAKTYELARYGDVVRVFDPLAAFCLCFRVSTWEKLGRFAENDILFDWKLSERAIREGMKLGICVGIYIYHNYRLFSNKDDYSHLI